MVAIGDVVDDTNALGAGDGGGTHGRARPGTQGQVRPHLASRSVDSEFPST
jgi:hypothetical protein